MGTALIIAAGVGVFTAFLFMAHIMRTKPDHVPDKYDWIFAGAVAFNFFIVTVGAFGVARLLDWSYTVLIAQF